MGLEPAYISHSQNNWVEFSFVFPPQSLDDVYSTQSCFLPPQTYRTLAGKELSLDPLLCLFLRDAHFVIGEEDEKKTEEDDNLVSDPKYVPFTCCT